MKSRSFFLKIIYLSTVSESVSQISSMPLSLIKSSTSLLASSQSRMTFSVSELKASSSSNSNGVDSGFSISDSSMAYLSSSCIDQLAVESNNQAGVTI